MRPGAVRSRHRDVAATGESRRPEPATASGGIEFPTMVGAPDERRNAKSASRSDPLSSSAARRATTASASGSPAPLADLVARRAVITMARIRSGQAMGRPATVPSVWSAHTSSKTMRWSSRNPGKKRCTSMVVGHAGWHMVTACPQPTPAGLDDASDQPSSSSAARKSGWRPGATQTSTSIEARLARTPRSVGRLPRDQEQPDPGSLGDAGGQGRHQRHGFGQGHRVGCTHRLRKAREAVPATAPVPPLVTDGTDDRPPISSRERLHVSHLFPRIPRVPHELVYASAR